MGLSKVAAGIEVTTEQRERGVAIADDTDTPLAVRLTDFAAKLPCEPATAATIVRARIKHGETIATSAREAGVAPMTARKTLYRMGEPIAQLDTRGRTALDEWLDGECSWTTATGAADDRATFVLAAYAATHDPIPGASGTIAGWLADG